MFYETAQTIGPGWHGKSFKPSHYDDMSWTHPTSAARHFRSPGSSPTLRRRIINYDDDQDDTSDPHMFPRRSPSFERKFFKNVWNEHPRREDPFEDRPSLFKRTVKHDWDKDVEDFEKAMRRDRDFGNEYEEPPADSGCDGMETGTGRVHHIPIMVERRRDNMKDAKTFRSRCSSPPPPPPSAEQEQYVDESDEWLRHHMNRLKQNFDSGFSTMQNRHGRHRFPRVDLKDLNSRPRAFTSPIPDWGPENIQTLPTRKHHSRVVLDEKRNPKSVFRSYSETHEDIPREHPTASRSHSDSHCPKTTYVTKVSVNVPTEKSEDARTTDHENSAAPPERPQRRTRCRPRKEENVASGQEEEQSQSTSKPAESQDQPKEKTDEEGEASIPKTGLNSDTKQRKHSLKDDRGASALLQISSVLQNVEDLIQHVEAYSGNGRDKQFRFLDEMLTRCMLRLDDVDTDGMDDIRLARKAAVRQVQACIEKLESRAAEEKTPDGNKNEPESEAKPTEDTPDEELNESSDKSRQSTDVQAKQTADEGAKRISDEEVKQSSEEESKKYSPNDGSIAEEAEQTRL